MADLAGQTFGPYRLEGVLGRGGMGEVYRARHLRLTGRQAAVKVLPASLAAEPDFLRRFEHEANSAASLDHPAILPVWDYGEQDGQPYIAMPLVTGGSLKELLEARGPLSPAEAEGFLTPIADALDFAHARGILHRDVKPANILLRDDGRPQLADFGIAKAIEAGQSPGLTRAGAGIGTPEYMAPEQIEGRAERKSDLYALGMSLYQMLSGRVPYDGATPYEIAIKQLSMPLPSIRQFRPDLSPAIEAILNTALAKDPGARYGSGREFADAFRRAVDSTAGAGAATMTAAGLHGQHTTPLVAGPATTPLPVGYIPTAPPVYPAPTPPPPPAPQQYAPREGYVPPGPPPTPVAAPPRRRNTAWPLIAAAIIAAALIVVIGGLGAYAAFFTRPAPTATVARATSTPPATAAPAINATQTAAANASANATATAAAITPTAAATATAAPTPTATRNTGATATAAAAAATGTANAVGTAGAVGTANAAATARASATAASNANATATAGADATATASGVAAQTATAAARPTLTPTRAPTAPPTARPPTATAVPPTTAPTRAPTAAPTAAPTRPPTSGWGPALPALNGGKPYGDPGGRFAFRIPNAWVQGDAGSSEVAFGPPDNAANFNVNLDQVAPGTTIDAYNEAADRQLRAQFGNYTLVSLDKVVVADRQAYRRVSRATLQGQNLQFLQVYFLDGTTAHILTFVTLPDAFGGLANTFNGIAGSYTVAE